MLTLIRTPQNILADEDMLAPITNALRSAQESAQALLASGFTGHGADKANLADIMPHLDETISEFNWLQAQIEERQERDRAEDDPYAYQTSDASMLQWHHGRV